MLIKMLPKCGIRGGARDDRRRWPADCARKIVRRTKRGEPRQPALD
jgi:hypothetical protein